MRNYEAGPTLPPRDGKRIETVFFALREIQDFGVRRGFERNCLFFARRVRGVLRRWRWRFERGATERCVCANTGTPQDTRITSKRILIARRMGSLPINADDGLSELPAWELQLAECLYSCRLSIATNKNYAASLFRFVACRRLFLNPQNILPAIHAAIYHNPGELLPVPLDAYLRSDANWLSRPHTGAPGGGVLQFYRAGLADSSRVLPPGLRERNNRNPWF
jgi:hypothetical protein